MDWNGVWQENKRFIGGVAAGVVLFFSAFLGIAHWLGRDLWAAQASFARAQQKLAEPMHSPSDLSAAQADHAALTSAFTALRGAVEFTPRPEFRFDPRQGSASNQFFAAVARTREDLLLAAGRSGLSIPSDLGLPALSPTREVELERHLEALDVIDRALRLAMDAGVERVDEIRIKLDPALLSGRGISGIERTQVELAMTGAAAPLVRLLAMTQEPQNGQALLVDSARMQPSRAKRDELQLEIVLVAAHLHGLEPPEEAGGA